MVWPRLTFKKVQAIGIRHTKFRPGTCIHMYINPRPRYYYFRFLKTNGRHIEILLPVLSLTLSLSSACDFPSTHQISSKSDHPRQSYDVITIFKVPIVRNFGFGLWVTVAHPQSENGGLCFIPEFRVDQIYSFGDSSIFMFWHFCFKLPIHAHLLGHIFPQMTSSIVLTPKGTFLLGNTSLSDKA